MSNWTREKRKQTPLQAPRRSSMPDLAALTKAKQSLVHILAAVFNSAGPKTTRAALLVRAYIRVVDKALEDYELARRTFTEYVARRGNTALHLLLRATGHIENCVGTIDRAQRFARRLAEDPETSSAVPKLNVLSTSATRRIKILRNGMEHLDQRFIAGTIGPGDLSAIWMDEDFIELEGERVQYTELAEWLRELHSLASRLSTFGAASA